MQERSELLLLHLPYQHRAAIYIENFTGNKTGVRCTQKQDGSGNLLRLARATERNGGINPLADRCVMQCRRGHIRFHPARSDTVHIDSIARKLRRKPLHHADDRPLARGIVTMERLSALTCRRTDQYYMTAGALALHLGHAVFHQAKKTVDVDGQSGAPLIVRELVDRSILRRPDPVISYNDVHLAETLNGCVNQWFCRVG